MPTYTKVGPFVDNGAPGIDHNFLNGVETQLVAVQYGFNCIATAYQLLNGVTINNGSTNTVTCTGVSSVPAGAKAVLVYGYFNPSIAGLQLNFYPHGSTPISPQVIAPTTGSTSFHVIAQLDATGKLDIYSGGGNSVVYLWMAAYIY